jgi:hypothetical protein
MLRTCPICGRVLDTRPQGRYKIECWPRHMLAAYGRETTAQQMARQGLTRYENRGALADNELPCPNSGAPCD